MNSKNRNGLIDLEKLLFAIVIVLYHAGTFYNDDKSCLCGSGFIAVEFFFVVSGYLIAAKADAYHGNDIWEDNIRLIIHRLGQLLPYMLVAALASNLFYMINCFDWVSLKDNLVMTFVDIFDLQMFGFAGFIATGVSWYISVLLIINFIFYPVLCKKSEIFTKYIVPISAVFVLGYLAHVQGYLNDPGKWIKIAYKGLLRGYADMFFGIMAFSVKNRINTIKESGVNFTLFRIAEVAGICGTFLYAIFHKASDAHDFLIVAVIFLSVSISYSKLSLSNLKIFDYKIWNVLGVYSFSIFLSHFWVKENLPRIFPEMGKNMMLLIYCILVFIFSICVHLLGTWLKNAKKKVLVYGIIIAAFFALCIPVAQSNKYVDKVANKLEWYETNVFHWE